MVAIRDVLSDAKQRIAPVSDSASLDAQLLLAEVLGCSRAHIIAHPEKSLAREQSSQYESLVARRAGGAPIAYILGRKAFYDREFIVPPAVLIPRPETEHLLELALAFVEQRAAEDNNPDRDEATLRPVTVVDIGTGSGALAVTLAARIPQAAVYATDISPEALAVAQENAARYNTVITFFLGDLLQPLIERHLKIDLVIANLPYIATGEIGALAVGKHEPHLALDGGADGLDLVRRLLVQAPLVVNPGALILLEIGAQQGEATRQFAQEKLKPRAVHIHQDYAGLDRVVAIWL